MNINWFPGHMHKAQKEIRRLLPEVDLVIEVIDARIPYSSQNPLLQQLGQQTPSIKLLNKADLADPELTAIWIDHLQQNPSLKAYAISLERPERVKQIPDWCRAMFPQREINKKPIQVMIMGVPNVGKSTIINQIANRSIAQTGNEPAVTKRQQRIKLPHNIILHDTPGVLWPRFDNQNSACRLAATAAIKDSVVAIDEIAFFVAEYLIQAYAEPLAERFKLEQLPTEPYQLLVDIGAARGALRKTGRVDIEKISKIFLNELRSGKIGPITLETPQMMLQEQRQTAEKLRLRAEQKAARKTRFKTKDVRS